MHWPAGDLALPVLLAFSAGIAIAPVTLQRRSLLGPAEGAAA